MSGSWDAVDYSLLGDDHVAAYREPGEVGHVWNGAPALLLTTTGAKSGEPRTAPLIYARDGDDYLIVASVGGMPKHPGWYHNLVAEPSATIEVGTETIEVVARTATDDEKPRLWGIVNETWPNYETYQTRTDRVIPVVVLTPVRGDA